MADEWWVWLKRHVMKFECFIIVQVITVLNGIALNWTHVSLQKLGGVCKARYTQRVAFQ